MRLRKFCLIFNLSCFFYAFWQSITGIRSTGITGKIERFSHAAQGKGEWVEE